MTLWAIGRAFVRTTAFLIARDGNTEHKGVTERKITCFAQPFRNSHSVTGLPDFSRCMIPKPEEMYQMNQKCTK
jgi:hypothetical protein